MSDVAPAALGPCFIGAGSVLDYRKLASELREMAHRRTLEAEILANRANRNGDGRALA
jgi:hypothetical protein